MRVIVEIIMHFLIGCVRWTRVVLPTLHFFVVQVLTDRVLGAQGNARDERILHQGVEEAVHELDERRNPCVRHILAAPKRC